MTRRTFAKFIALAIVSGIPYLFIRIAVQEVSPSVVVFGRTLIGALVLLPLVAPKGEFAQLKGHWTWIGVFAVIELILPFGALGIAEQKISSSLAGLIIAAVPIINGIITYQMRIDRDWDLRRISGIVIGLLGVVSLVGLDFRADTWWSVAITFVAVVGYALGPIVIAQRLSNISAMAVTTVAQALTALVYLPVIIWEFSNGNWRLTPSVSWQSWISIAALGVLSTALAFIWFFQIIDEIGPSRITVLTYLNPVVAIAAGVAFLHEPITLAMWVGFPLVILGSILAAQRTNAS